MKVSPFGVNTLRSSFRQDLKGSAEYKTVEEVIMGIVRVIGIIVFFGGIALIVGGIFATRSLGDSVRTFLGIGLTKETLWYFIGGGAAVVVSLFLLLGGRS